MTGNQRPENEPPAADQDAPVDSNPLASQQRRHVPSELRLMIYRIAIEDETGNHIRTIGYDNQGTQPTCFIRTREMHWPRPTVLDATREAQLEMERLTVPIPTYLVTRPGNTVVSLIQGRPHTTHTTPIEHALADRRVLPDTHFYMERETFRSLTNALAGGLVDASSLAWLGSLIIDGHCFSDVMRRYGSGAGMPFTLFPALRRVVVMFHRRVRDFVVLEGRYAAGLREVEIVPYTGGDRVVPPGLGPVEYAILDAFNAVGAVVESIRGAGIELRWAIVVDGFCLREQRIEEL